MNYPKAKVTADVIPFNVDMRLIGLVKRGGEPFKGKWAIPGGYFNPVDFGEIKADVSLEDCGYRELEEETGITVDNDKLTTFPRTFRSIYVGYYDQIGRDPRGRTITMVYVLQGDNAFFNQQTIKANDDAADFKWFSLEEILGENAPQIVFDHHKIIKRTIDILSMEEGVRQKFKQ